MKTLRFVVLVALLSGAGRIDGEAVEPVAAELTLEQAVAEALSANHRIGAADAMLGAAEAGLEQARSARRPRIELSETFVKTTNPVFVFGNLLGQEAFAEQNFALPSLNEPETLDNFNTRLSVSQPLWTGGRIRNGIEAARLSRDAVAAGRERTRQEVVQQVIEAYTGAVLAASELGVSREALQTARANVRLVADLREAGLVVQSDLLQARVRRAEVEEMVIRAESAVEITVAALNLALGRDLDAPIALPRALDAGDEPEEPLERLVEEARGNRPDLRAATGRVDAAGRVVRLTRAGRRPQVGLAGMFETNAEDLPGADGSNWSVIVGARFTAFDGRETQARVRQAQQQERGARWERDLLEQSIDLEVRRAFHERRAARKRLEQALQAVDLAREGLRIVQDRYREGLTTLPELLDAETALTRATTRSVAARRDVLLSRASLDLAVGRF